MTIGMSFPPPAAAGSRRPHTFLCRDLQKNCPLPSRQEQAGFFADLQCARRWAKSQSRIAGI